MIDYEDELDEYFNEIASCHTKDCIMVGAHFASECHTAEDLENYEILEFENTKHQNWCSGTDFKQ